MALTAGEAAIVLVGDTLEYNRAESILKKEGGHLMFIQLHYGLPLAVTSDEIEQRIAVIFSHILSVSGLLGSRVRELYRNLTPRIVKEIDHAVVGESYRSVLILTLTSPHLTLESEEMFMARAVALSLRSIFERKTKTSFNL